MMQVGVSIYGLKPVLETLRYVDRDLYNQTTKDIRKVSQPLVQKVKGDFPTSVLSGFMRPAQNSKRRGGAFPHYDVKKARQGVGVKIGGRKNQMTNSWPVVRIQQKNAGAMIFDMAGAKNRGGTFVKNLEKEKYGRASRVMWKSVRSNLPLVEKNIKDAVEKVEKAINAQLQTSIERREKQSAFTKTQGRNALGQFGG
jgi:hypothetical protein